VTPLWRNTIDTLEMLPEMVRDERLRRGLSHRAAGAEMGYAFADLCRFEQRKKVPSLTSVLSMLRWLAVSPEPPKEPTS